MRKMLAAVFVPRQPGHPAGMFVLELERCQLLVLRGSALSDWTCGNATSAAAVHSQLLQCAAIPDMTGARSGARARRVKSTSWHRAGRLRIQRGKVGSYSSEGGYGLGIHGLCLAAALPCAAEAPAPTSRRPPCPRRTPTPVQSAAEPPSQSRANATGDARSMRALQTGRATSAATGVSRASCLPNLGTYRAGCCGTQWMHARIVSAGRPCLPWDRKLLEGAQHSL